MMMMMMMMTMIKSHLNAKNKITSIGALDDAVLRYSFGIINWRLEEIRKFDRKTREVLTMYKLQHNPTGEEEACYKLK
jgi:hypothetical protein